MKLEVILPVYAFRNPVKCKLLQFAVHIVVVGFHDVAGAGAGFAAIIKLYFFIAASWKLASATI